MFPPRPLAGAWSFDISMRSLLRSTLSLNSERVPYLWVDTGSGRERPALSRGERVARDGAFSSRRGSGEGLVCPHRNYPSRLASCTLLTNASPSSNSNPFGIRSKRVLK